MFSPTLRARLRHEVVPFVLGVLAVAVVTILSYRFHIRLAVTGFLFVILVVLVARMGGLVSSVVLSIIASLCLTYVTPPSRTFGIGESVDLIAIATFLVTSLVISGLVSKLRMMTEEARSSVNRRLIDAEERERTRIARELHDDINQRIAMLAVNLDRLKQDSLGSAGELQRQIVEIGKQVDDLGSDLSAISHRLHSSKLEILGLAAAAAGFCGELSSHQGVQIEFHSESVQKSLPPEISICLFRVLQEALRNAISHSGSRKFHVALKADSIGIELLVRDSGVGFDPEEAVKGHGLGLTSMRERLRLVNGDLFIDSQLHRGTILRARVPLAPTHG